MQYKVLMLCFMSSLSLAQEDVVEAITIKRSVCYGNCPAYAMTVFSDGTYFWVGEEHVAKKGYFYGHVAPGVFARALQLLHAAHYREFNDRYSSVSDGCKEIATDNPSTYLVVQSSTSSKTIKHYAGCRGFANEERLIALENQIDAVLATSQWLQKPQPGKAP